ncbi:MAG TPA: DUF5946 family protein [Vicinamibacterales bacterium]|nr:DUF5946 family protein [Vicinamibacterales bacterium]
MSANPVDHCAMCGFPGGREACRALFDDVSLRVRALAWTGSLSTWRLMHDVYAIQHEEEACGTFTALVTHLGGVCWALEHGGNEGGYRALQKLVERNPSEGLDYPPAPGIPSHRGTVTVASLKDAEEPERLVAGVDRWARAAWLAYAGLQPLARDWVKQALMLKKIGR